MGASTSSREACGIVSFQPSIVNVDEKDIYLTGSVHANREGHFDIRSARGTGDEDSSSRLTHDGQSHCVRHGGEDVRGAQHGDMDLRQERGFQRIPLSVGDQNRPGVCQPANGFGDPCA